MKKFIRGTLIASGILILVGIILLTFCASVGGISLFKEAFANNEFCFGEIDFDNYDGFKDCDNWGNEDMIWEDNQYPQYFGKQNNIVIGEGGEISALSVEIASANIEIKESADSKIRLDCEVRDKISCFIDDGELFLREGNGNDNHNDKISLYLPKGVELTDVDINLGAGKIIANELKTDTLTIRAGAGSISFENASVEDIDIIMGAGKIDFAGSVSGDMDIECGVGKINMNIDGNQENWNYDIECGAGTVILGGDKYEQLMKQIDIDYDADNDCGITCALGKVTLFFQE